jgi:hypothetical protein
MWGGGSACTSAFVHIVVVVPSTFKPRLMGHLAGFSRLNYGTACGSYPVPLRAYRK